MVFSYELLYFAWGSMSKGKREAPNQAQYQYELEERLYDLQERLESGTYQPAPLRLKKIYIPKYREVQVPSTEDKIVQHAICDAYLYPLLTNTLIRETSACIRGRGEKAAAKILKKQLCRFWRVHHKKPYVLKCDIHHFFASIPHERLLGLIDRYVPDEDVLALMRKFIALTEVGLPLGLQQSQLLANLYLSEMDHKIKELLRVAFYGRYMDDFYILAESQEELVKYLHWITGYVESIGLKMNPKTKISYNRVDYLGFTYFVTDTGKVVRRLSKNKRQTQRHYLRLTTKEIQAGKCSPEEAAKSYCGWRKHAMKGNCRNLVLAMDQYFDEQLRGIGYMLHVVSKNEVIICPRFPKRQ